MRRRDILMMGLGMPMVAAPPAPPSLQVAAWRYYRPDVPGPTQFGVNVWANINDATVRAFEVGVDYMPTAIGQVDRKYMSVIGIRHAEGPMVVAVETGPLQGACEVSVWPLRRGDVGRVRV